LSSVLSSNHFIFWDFPTEQVAVQKKLLEREQTLYNTLLGQWKDTPKLGSGSTGLTMNFSATDDYQDNYDEDEMNDSDPDYTEGPYFGPGPAPKKSKSMLRRQRKSGKTFPKQQHYGKAMRRRTSHL